MTYWLLGYAAGVLTILVLRWVWAIWFRPEFTMEDKREERLRREGVIRG